MIHLQLYSAPNEKIRIWNFSNNQINGGNLSLIFARFPSCSDLRQFFLLIIFGLGGLLLFNEKRRSLLSCRDTKTETIKSFFWSTGFPYVQPITMLRSQALHWDWLYVQRASVLESRNNVTIFKITTGQLIPYVFLIFSILPKNERKQFDLRKLRYHKLVKSDYFVHFLGELKIPKRHLEINWPLLIVKFEFKICFIHIK